jgi:hypothetical protein
MTQLCFQSLVNPFSLTIRLRMKRRQDTKPRAKQLGHSFSKLTREPTITIRDELFAQTMVTENIVYIEFCKSFCKQFSLQGTKCTIFVSRSTKTQIESWPLAVTGSLIIKSIDTHSKAFQGPELSAACRMVRGVSPCYEHS